mmetsp:Transcript_22615/g.31518  ORF Transcript_22615/g.31518 Transcript_22615/m.31518 type:complete len:299 (+) Transcript_22615:339-1235(+)
MGVSKHSYTHTSNANSDISNGAQPAFPLSSARADSTNLLATGEAASFALGEPLAVGGSNNMTRKGNKKIKEIVQNGENRKVGKEGTRQLPTSEILSIDDRIISKIKCTPGQDQTNEAQQIGVSRINVVSHPERFVKSEGQAQVMELGGDAINKEDESMKLESTETRESEVLGFKGQVPGVRICGSKRGTYAFKLAMQLLSSLRTLHRNQAMGVKPHDFHLKYKGGRPATKKPRLVGQLNVSSDSLAATFNFKHPCLKCKKNKQGLNYCRGTHGHTDPEYEGSQPQAMKEWLAMQASIP